MNNGRITQNIVGIQGLAPGGQSTVNMDVNKRYHRLQFNCLGIAWKNPTISFTGGTTGTTIVPPTAHAIVNAGVITGIAIDTGGSGYTGAPTVVITDEVYGGNLFDASATAVLTLDAVSSVTVVSGGVAGPVPPERFFTSFVQKVNGVNIRDISPLEIQSLDAADNQTTIASRAVNTVNGVINAFTPTPLGVLNVYFTDPSRRIVSHDTATSWDLAGQSTYQITFGISANISQISLTGIYEFDYLRNAVKDSKGNLSYFLRVEKQHSYSFNANAGVNDFTTLPITYPILRLRLYGAAAPTHIEVMADGNKILEGTVEQLNNNIRTYGFNTDAFSTALVWDIDQRLGSALSVAKSLDLRVWCGSSGALYVIEESLAPAFV